MIIRMPGYKQIKIECLPTNIGVNQGENLTNFVNFLIFFNFLNFVNFELFVHFVNFVYNLFSINIIPTSTAGLATCGRDHCSVSFFSRRAEFVQCKQTCLEKINSDEIYAPSVSLESQFNTCNDTLSVEKIMRKLPCKKSASNTFQLFTCCSF